MRGRVAIIIPTHNQPKALHNTLFSIVKWTHSVYRIYVVDNSKEQYAKKIAGSISADIAVIGEGRNLGWMGGINYGVANSSEDYVMFLNDDIQILPHDNLWLQRMLETFIRLSDVGAVVPTSNNVMGYQNFIHDRTGQYDIVPIISGLCVLMPRKIFEKVGELDEALSGGDDLDYSLRIRDVGYRLVIRNDVFVYHYGSLTGKSVYGEYWNSAEYTDKIKRQLITKHGFKKYLDIFQLKDMGRGVSADVDWESNAMLAYCIGDGAEIGCGGNKIKPDVTGVDITPKDQRGMAGCQIGVKSVADITVKDYILPFNDNQYEYLVARHVLEHIVDDVGALKEWVRVLKHGGLLIIAAPNEDVVDGMPLDPTHKHAYTVESLKTRLNLICNYEILEITQKDISFVFVARVIK